MTMEWFGEGIVGRVNSETIKTLRDAAQAVGTKADAVVPVHWGALKGSRTIIGSNGGKHQEIAYGGAAAGYALIVHEMPDGNNFTKAGTGPKYLETPMRENADAVLKMLQDATARGLKGG